jgi:hypothetical protein
MELTFRDSDALTLSGRANGMVTGCLRNQDSQPGICRQSRALNQRGEIELALAELMSKLDTGGDNSGMVKAFEAKHRPDALFHPPVILVDEVVQVGIAYQWLARGRPSGP